VFFSSHILTDIEAIADQVAIVAAGQVQSQGTPTELMKRTVLGIDVTVRVTDELGELVANASRVRRIGDELSLMLPADADVDAWLASARDKGAKVVAVAPRHETLEELFLREIGKAS